MLEQQTESSSGWLDVSIDSWASEVQQETLTEDQKLREEYEKKSTELKEQIAEIQEKNNQRIQKIVAEDTLSQKEIILENMKKKEQENKQTPVFTSNTQSESELQAQRDKVMDIKPTVAQTKINLELTDFKDAGTTWWANLNPTGEIIPGKFKAIYFDSESQKVSKTLVQDDISINRLRADKSFGAYFVGEIEIKEQNLYEFFISQSWADSRVILDGKEIMRSWGKTTIPISLNPGKYMLEVEFLNNWHVIDFAVGYSQTETMYTKAEAVKALGDIVAIENLEVWYTGVYESNNPWHIIPVVLKPSSNPVVLILGSYSTVDWEISNPSNVDIKAIVYSGFEPWITVGWELQDNLPILRLGTPVYTHKIIPTCRATWSIYHCEGWENDFTNLQKLSLDLFQKKLTGFSGEYGSSMFSIPEVVLDAAEYARIESDLNDIRKERSEFNNKKNLDNVFQ